MVNTILGRDVASIDLAHALKKVKLVVSVLLFFCNPLELATHLHLPLFHPNVTMSL